MYFGMLDLDPNKVYCIVRIRNPAKHFNITMTSVGDPDLDPHVFGPPRSESGSISQMYGTRSLHFSHKCVERTEIMHAK